MSSFYSPVAFNSASPVFAKHLNFIVAQQRVSSLNAVSTLSCTEDDYEYNNFEMVNNNVQLGCWMRIAMHSSKPFTLSSFITHVMLHNHNRTYIANPDQVLYLS